MMIGRNREYSFLEKIWTSKNAFLLVSGREHIGKTTLIRTFANDKNALYFSAINASDQINRSRFEAALYDRFDLQKQKSTRSWKELFRIFGNADSAERKLLVLDHCDYLIQADPEIVKRIKKAWEDCFLPKSVMLIMILSNGKVLNDLKDNKSFTSKLTYHINLQPLTLPEMMKEYPHHDFNQLMMLYSITGGVPKYWDLFAGCIETKDFIARISEHFFNTNDQLFEGPVGSIDQQCVRSEIFNSILSAIAQGEASLQQIESFTGYKMSEIYSVLKVLKRLGLTAEKQSVFGNKEKIPIYMITDPMTLFWYRFVFPYYTEICCGNISDAQMHLKTYFVDHVQNCFRMAVKKIVKRACRKQTLPLSDEVIGVYSDQKQTIDLVVIDEKQKTLMFGACVFKSIPYDVSEYNQFINRCKQINPRIMKKYKDYKIIYSVFANDPFDKALLEYAMDNQDLLLFNGITMYSLIS